MRLIIKILLNEGDLVHLLLLWLLRLLSLSLKLLVLVIKGLLRWVLRVSMVDLLVTKLSMLRNINKLLVLLEAHWLLVQVYCLWLNLIILRIVYRNKLLGILLLILLLLLLLLRWLLNNILSWRWCGSLKLMLLGGSSRVWLLLLLLV